MSFRPLPAKFTDHLSSLNPAADIVLELGSGDGEFTRLIRQHTECCFGLDRRAPAMGSSCNLVGDARSVPLREGTLAVLVAGNLVRHLVPRHRLADWIMHWRRLLKPGGALYLFEDEPDPAQRAERNFADLQAFLARLAPTARGPLLPLAKFRRAVAADSPAGDWIVGHERNVESVDKSAVLHLLRGSGGQLTGPTAKLYESIQRSGIAPGGYWWACVGPVPGDPVAEEADG